MNKKVKEYIKIMKIELCNFKIKNIKHDKEPDPNK
jgi:hypothetical protein